MTPAHRDYATASAIAVLGGIGIVINQQYFATWLVAVAWIVIAVGFLIAVLQVVEQIMIDEAGDEYYCYRCHRLHKFEGGTDYEND